MDQPHQWQEDIQKEGQERDFPVHRVSAPTALPAREGTPQTQRTQSLKEDPEGAFAKKALQSRGKADPQA